MARQSTKGALFILTTFTDLVYGSMTFYFGDQRIPVNSFGATTGPVYPCVTNWGALRSILTDTGDATSELSLELNAKMTVHPSNFADLRFKVYQVFQQLAIRDAALSIYQWNWYNNGTELVWAGYWGGITDTQIQDGIQTITVRARSEPRASMVIIGQVVDATNYPNAPSESVGRMVDHAYGDMITTLAASSTLAPGFFGYPVHGVAGLFTDRTPGGGGTYSRYLFSKGDGTSNATTNTPQLEALESGSPFAGDYWVYMPEVNAYAVPSSGSLSSSTTDTASVRVDLLNSPTLYVVLRPTEAVTITSGGVSAINEGYKVIDDDPSNSISLPNTNDTIIFKVPGLSLTSAVIDSVMVAVDVGSSGCFFDLGIWNPNETAGANWWGGGTKKRNYGPVARTQYFTGDTGSANGKYLQGNAATSAGGSTASQFQNGRFVGMNAGKDEIPVQFKLIRTSGAGTLNVYAISVIVKLSYPFVRTGFRPVIYSVGGELEHTSKEKWGDFFGGVRNPNPHDPGYTQFYGGGQGIMSPATENPSLNLILQQAMQKDDGSGTYTGSANTCIKKMPDIVKHILKKTAGLAVNDTASTLGNFPDGRTEEVAGEKVIACDFGHDPVTAVGSVKAMQDRWPFFAFEEQNVWEYFGDDMNPDPSRLFRSSSDVFKIARRHITNGDIRYREDDVRGLLNSVILNYGHGSGNNRQQGSVQYDNEVSQKYFPASNPPLVVDEPWVLKSVLTDSTPPAATFLAKWYGRRSALPRMEVTVSLTQAFYSLKRGHVVQFDTDVDTIGIAFPAWHAGIPLHAYIRNDVLATDQAEDSTPTFIPGSGTMRTMWGCRHQTDFVQLHINDTAAYTEVNNGWKYYDGSAWTSFSGVVSSDATDPDTIFQRTGDPKISWTKPLCTTWKKAELTIAGTVLGPCYWFGLDYNTATNSGAGGGLTTVSASWADPIWVVTDVSRIAGGVGQYPRVVATLREVY